MVSQDIPSMGYPQYMEFELNTYRNVFGREGALLDAKFAT